LLERSASLSQVKAASKNVGPPPRQRSLIPQAKGSKSSSNKRSKSPLPPKRVSRGSKILHIECLHAWILQKDTLVFSTFVRLRFGSQIQQSRSQEGEAPRWNEPFEFVVDDGSPDSVYIEVFIVEGNELVGIFPLSLDDVPISPEVCNVWLPIQLTPNAPLRGRIHMTFHFVNIVQSTPNTVSQNGEGQHSSSGLDEIEVALDETTSAIESATEGSTISAPEASPSPDAITPPKHLPRVSSQSPSASTTQSASKTSPPQSSKKKNSESQATPRSGSFSQSAASTPLQTPQSRLPFSTPSEVPPPRLQLDGSFQNGGAPLSTDQLSHRGWNQSQLDDSDDSDRPRSPPSDGDSSPEHGGKDRGGSDRQKNPDQKRSWLSNFFIGCMCPAIPSLPLPNSMSGQRSGAKTHR